MTKGADSHIIPRLAEGQDELIKTTERYLQTYAEDGLRTLILAQKEVDPEYYDDWSRQYN